MVSPTRTDPVARNASQILGGPRGRWAQSGRPGRALQLVLLTGTVTFLLGALRTVPCARVGWSVPDRYELLCYSDIPILYTLRGLADGGLPYLDGDGDQPLEYPVLTGMLAWSAAVLARSAGAATYYWITAVLLLVCFLVALAATAVTVRTRVWDGLLMALAPSVVLASLINWDWLAVALTAGGLLAWSRSRPWLAGAVLGLAVAAKFFPLLLFGPLLVLCWRRRRIADWGRAAAAALAAWTAVNLPFALAAPEQWSYFFTFSSDRGQDFGSPWLALSLLGFPVSGDTLNVVAAGLLVVLCAGIAALTLLSPRPPRLAQVAFLVVAAFLVVNKVYSPQFVLWLLPLAVLARPRWRDVLIWQACEAVYFVAIWWYLVALTPDAEGLPEEIYAWAILIHIAGVVYLALMVVRDILRPEFDPVRSDRPPGVDAFSDDPGGGVLDRAPDRLRESGAVDYVSPST